MATPNARQISFGTSVVPKLEAASTSTQVTREDGNTTGIASYTDVILDTTVAKRFGGKGTVTIAADQEIDGWVSVTHPQSVISDTTNGMDQAWEDTELNWDEVNEITSADFTIRTDSPSVNCNFIYVRNTGSVNFIDSTCDLTDDPTIAHDDDDGAIQAGMMVTGAGIPDSSYVGVRTSDTSFELYSIATESPVSTIGGSSSNVELTFTSPDARIFLDGTEQDILIPGGASIALRLNSVAVGNIKIDTAAGSTTIQYVLAKE